MASTETIPEAPASTPAKAGLPLIPLMLAVLAALALMLGVLGGAGFWLYKSGRLQGLSDTHAVGVKAPVVPARPVLTQVVLEPLLVNLADSDGRSYLRVAVTLVTEQKPVASGAKPKEEKAEKGKPANEFEAAERDVLLDVLGRQTGAALLAPDGKERLKQAIRAALKQRVSEVTVDDVLFTDFLVQR